jgi:hypothetical protein
MRGMRNSLAKSCAGVDLAEGRRATAWDEADEGVGDDTQLLAGEVLFPLPYLCTPSVSLEGSGCEAAALVSLDEFGFRVEARVPSAAAADAVKGPTRSLAWHATPGTAHVGRHPLYRERA